MNNWEQDTIQKVLLETIKEQRRARRWRIFFRLLIVLAVVWGFWLSYGSREDGDETKTGPQVGVSRGRLNSIRIRSLRA